MGDTNCGHNFHPSCCSVRQRGLTARVDASSLRHAGHCLVHASATGFTACVLRASAGRPPPCLAAAATARGTPCGNGQSSTACRQAGQTQRATTAGKSRTARATHGWRAASTAAEDSPRRPPAAAGGAAAACLAACAAALPLLPVCSRSSPTPPCEAAHAAFAERAASPCGSRCARIFMDFAHTTVGGRRQCKQIGNKTNRQCRE